MKKTKSRIVFEWINYIILFFVAMLCLYPIIYVVFASVSRSSLLMQHSGLLLKPLDFNLDSYLSVFRTDKIISGYKNTMTILIIGVSLNMFLTICAAYFFTRKDIMLQKLLMFLIIVTMFFSGGLIPVYLNVCELGIDNTLWAVILPSAVSTFNLIILKNAFASIPDELEEAAMIDGASPIKLYFLVVFPMMKPISITVAILNAMWIWNDYLLPYLVIGNKYRTIPIAVQYLQGGYGSRDMGALMAMLVLSIIPVVVFYLLCQKYIIKGVVAGAVKG